MRVVVIHPLTMLFSSPCFLLALFESDVLVLVVLDGLLVQFVHCEHQVFQLFLKHVGAAQVHEGGTNTGRVDYEARACVFTNNLFVKVRGETTSFPTFQIQ